MQLMTLSEIRRGAQSGPVSARVHVQVESAAPKFTREQKPYCELSLADACDRMTLRVWSDHPAYKACSALNSESFIELTGEFNSHSQYGLEAQKWTVRPLTPQEKNELLQGPAELRAKQNADWQFILETIGAIGDPRLRALCDAFVKDLGERFRRTAAARRNHHARRGGLVEHTAQMMRVAVSLGPLYPQLNVDLLVAGTLLHDSGKLWENALPENGFVMDYDERGELIGHISIGLELVNSLWRRLSSENADSWKQFSCTCSISSARIMASNSSDRRLFQKPRRQWRSITSTISMRDWKCSPPAISQRSRWPTEFSIGSGRCRENLSSLSTDFRPRQRRQNQTINYFNSSRRLA